VLSPPPAPVTPFPIEADAPVRREPKMALAGFHEGVYLRDPTDAIRIYVRGRLHLDFYSTFGQGVSTLPAADGGALLTPRFFVRRARVELGGELFRRWFFLFGLDFGGQPITNPLGGQELAAGSPGEQPTATTARYAPVQTAGNAAVLANAYINYTVLPQFNVMLGQHRAPFSMEHRTSNMVHPWMERILPIRAFVQPNDREIGMVLWGDWNQARLLSYELGVFVGDGPNRPQVDAYPDFIGRVFSRPFARGEGGGGALEKVQIGVSGHHGERDPKYVGYDYPAITTAQGWVLWDPRYRDSMGRLLRVLPSGAQNRFGGELRVPIQRFDVRGEAYYVNNGTREAVDGQQLRHTERLGQVTGVGWYVHVSAWALGDAFVNGDPGLARPPRQDLARKPDIDHRGLELMAHVSGINASYDGASRGGPYDARTPGRPGGTTSNITVYSFGLGASYWYTRFIRATVNYIAYLTPGSGDGGNLAQVPGNFIKDPGRTESRATWMHELGARLAANF
jgi:hypothetical protein